MAGTALAAGLAQPAVAHTTGHGGGHATGHELPLTQYVNPFVGTAVSSTSGYAGNVNPGAQVPFGMVDFGPDTPRTDFNGSGGYLTAANATSGKVNFFSLTHLNGPGCPGQGVVGMMPASTPQSVATAAGKPVGVTFKTATESARPGEYAVTLDNQVGVELTATTRTGMAQFTYPGKDAGYFSLDTRLNANSNMSSSAGKISAASTALTVADDGRVLTGKTVAPAFCTPYGTQFNSNVYFYLEADKPLRAQPDGSTVNTVHDGATVLQYDLTDKDPTLTIRVGISSVSVANAKLNLKTENARSTFDQVRAKADATWNSRLNAVQVAEAARPASLTAAQRTDLTKFYTGLYRVFGSPTTYSDVNGDFRSMEATPPYPGTVDTAGGVPDRPVTNVRDYTYKRPDGSTGSYTTHYSSLSMWDTYRSQAQLLAMLAPDVASDVMQSLVVDGEQCGAFPHWVDASDDSTPMAGDNALPVLAASYAFGATGFDVTTAARLVKQSVFDPTSACNGRASMSDATTYLRDGYYPDATSANIERYNSDHAAAAFLSALPERVLTDPSVSVTQADIARLDDRASWWKNIFDFADGTIVAREAPTSAGTPGPLEPGSYHESTEPNYFWSFGYAWPDLIRTIGTDGAVDRLNTLFSVDSALTKVPTLQQLNGGQDSQGFYMGNEMGFPAPWAYDFAGKPASTQYVVQQLMRTAFSTARDGLPGDDDMGALSSWYVFAGIGMFPVSQAEDGLALSTPQFPDVTLHLGKRTVRIHTDRDAATSPFILSLRVDGRTQDRSWLAVDRLSSSRTLSYTLSTSPTTWATTTDPTGPTTSRTSLQLDRHVQRAGTTTAATATVTFGDDVAQPGTVVFRDGRRILARVPLGAGAQATATVPTTVTRGVHSLTAVFVPDDRTRAGGSTSKAQHLVVLAPPHHGR
ncbi:glycoside hydrolase domain-containing protein [Luteimicrobium xylanilyticum]|uniref:glycoside hydrolase domain-containing protein n=1 Tax=Luteimicrobium xylanilyticum TaxID=1133546 RepID=UPI00068593DC|nr:glycoside hydrolase domain-containing protein [Luteimicrobium xylanilyticum]